MERISLEQLILGVRNSYIDIIKKYEELNKYIYCEKSGLKECHFYFGEDLNGNNNFICSVVDKLCQDIVGSKYIVYKSYSNDFIINGYQAYRLEVVDAESFSKGVNNILSSEFMKNRPYKIKINDKLIKINPESIELLQKVNKLKEQHEINLKISSGMINKDDYEYEKLLVYKGIDDYILTTELYDKDYLRELKIYKSDLTNYYKQMIERESNLKIYNSKKACEKKGEYNIEDTGNGFKLALRPSVSRHIV